MVYLKSNDGSNGEIFDCKEILTTQETRHLPQRVDKANFQNCKYRLRLENICFGFCICLLCWESRTGWKVQRFAIKLRERPGKWLLPIHTHDPTASGVPACRMLCESRLLQQLPSFDSDESKPPKKKDEFHDARLNEPIYAQEGQRSNSGSKAGWSCFTCRSKRSSKISVSKSESIKASQIVLRREEKWRF